MKKIISISIIALSLIVLVNCSPKTSKKVADAKPSSKETTARNESRSEESTTQKPVDTPPPVATPPSTPPVTETGDNSATNTAGGGQTTAYSGLTPQQQVDLFKKTNDGRVARGKPLFESSCKKCHALHQPSSRTALDWVNIMSSMGPKAKLGEAEYMYVASYLVKNAKP